MTRATGPHAGARLLPLTFYHWRGERASTAGEGSTRLDLPAISIGLGWRRWTHDETFAYTTGGARGSDLPTGMRQCDLAAASNTSHQAWADVFPTDWGEALGEARVHCAQPFRTKRGQSGALPSRCPSRSQRSDHLLLSASHSHPSRRHHTRSTRSPPGQRRSRDRP
jgi:hypothetical protein